MEYYIQDTRQFVGNYVLWWRPKGAGYTTEINDAGLYSKEEALKIIGGRDTDKAWPRDLVEAHIVRHVRMEPLYDHKNKQLCERCESTDPTLEE